MSRWSIVLMLAAAAAAQQPDTKKPESQESKPESKPESKGDVQLPPEEDTSAQPEQYSFNPVKSKRDVAVGEFYFKKGDYKGAAQRFITATKWNDANAEAWLRLGETREKQQDSKAAREAYERYLQLAPDGKYAGKNAAEVKKRLDKLK
jgi:Flp pilus assembly protein TadD